MSHISRSRTCRRRAPVALLLAILGGLACPAGAIVTSNVFLPIQRNVGAERFYNNGYYGFDTVIANVEAGHVWDGHEVFAQPAGMGVYYSQDISLNSIFPLRQYDWHATAIGSMLVGLGPYQPDLGYYYYQFGMAPGSSLISSAIATEWIGDTGEFDISTESFNSGYLIPMRDGVWMTWVAIPGLNIQVLKTADVVNSSWGFDDPTGTAQETMTIDALIAAHRQTVTLAAGNNDGSAAQVVGPASGYNGIAVGALTGDNSTPPYNTVATFSDIGPNDFNNPKLGLNLPAVRAAVDIAAPGTDIVAAAYLGATGTFSGATDPFPGYTGTEDNLYWIGLDGTSFAAPIVAGGAALMIDAARQRFPQALADKAADTLVVKAALLNAARKIPGWTNHTTLVDGVLTTTQGLDYASGAGALDLDRTYDQYLLGNTDLTGLGGGTISPLGWDYGNVAQGLTNDYKFGDALQAGDVLTATLTWLIHRTFDSASGTSAESYFNDLDLQLWSVVDGQLDTLVAQSASLYNNVEHMYVTIPDDGHYALRVVFFANTFDVPGNSPRTEDYGLAWYVPEPGGTLTLALAVCLGLRRRHGGKRGSLP